MKLIKELSFSGAHFLNNYDGKCANLHGHTWKLKVEIDYTNIPYYNMLNNNGMLIDFSKIKDLIMNKFDHDCINKNIKINPTAENIAAIICIDIYLYVYKYIFDTTDVSFNFLDVIITLYESDTSYVVTDFGSSVNWINCDIPDHIRIPEDVDSYIKILDDIRKYMGENIWI